VEKQRQTRERQTTLNIFQAIILGVVEGLTEYIPVSSTAHLLIAQKLLGVSDPQIVESFTIIVQAGAIIALIVYFWSDLWNIVTSTLSNLGGVFKFNALPENAKMGWYILIATIPAGMIGFIFNDLVETMFSQPLLHSSIRLGMAAVLMTMAEFFGKQHTELKNITWRESLVVGLFQIFAIFPGASRSGSTISGGILMGLNRKSAARFAMLISAPIMLAATGYEVLKLFLEGYHTSYLLPILIGVVTAGITGWFSIRWLLKYVQGHSLYPFAFYCVLIAWVSYLFHIFG